MTGTHSKTPTGIISRGTEFGGLKYITVDGIKAARTIIDRAKELGPSVRQNYGNEVDLTLDEDALIQAISEYVGVTPTD